MNWLRFAAAAAALCLPTGAAALHKCTTPDGKVTYQAEPCPAAATSKTLGSQGGADALSPEAAYSQSRQALERGDFDSYAKLAAREARDKLAGTERDKRDAMFAAMKLSLPAQVKITERLIAGDGKTATLKAQGVGKNAASGSEEPAFGTIEMVKEEGQWRVRKESWAAK